jgi:hypothetical protein
VQDLNAYGGVQKADRLQRKRTHQFFSLGIKRLQGNELKNLQCTGIGNVSVNKEQKLMIMVLEMIQ